MGTEIATSGGGSGLFRDVLEGSFPELYAPPVEREPEEAPPAEGAEGEEGAEPRAEAEEAEEAGKDAEPAEGGEEGGAEEPPVAEEELDEYQQRIADIEHQVRTRM